MIRSKTLHAFLAATMLTTPVVLSPLVATPAHALFGFGDIVFDPSNYAQNVLTAARTLEQINNQITSLQNEAQMLINMGKNLASLPHSSLAQIQSSIHKTQQLLSQAQLIAYDVSQIDEAFASTYGPADLSASDHQLIDGTRERWQNTVAGLQDAMRVQAGVVGNLDTYKSEIGTLTNASQNAVGALQATQTGNQILALQAQQLTDLSALLAAQSRAQSLEAADRAAEAEQAREMRRRFLAPGPGYQPGNAQMFND